jgi:hypothetical protein
MPLDGSARPRKPSPPRGANGIFRQNFGQRIRELLIEYGNVGAASHVFIACSKAENIISLLPSSLKVDDGERV